METKKGIRIIKGLLLMLFCCLTQLTHAQDVKQESEKRIPEQQVPELSKVWLEQAFPARKKVKWYLEETSGKKSYEAKFKWEGCRYSVEFSQDGQIEDVEKKVKWESLAEDQKARLYLGFSQFRKFRIGKVQEQWRAASSEQLQRAIRQKDPSLAVIRFEVEFTAEIDGEIGLWEGLFEKGGQLISRRKVLLRPTDNLDY